MMKDLSMHIMDIAQNSVRAGAGRVEISVSEDSAADALVIEITDDGRGMPPEMVKAVKDPFFTTRSTRAIGLGLPLLDQTCRQCGGSLSIESKPGEGTAVTARMRLSHIDRPPLGDVLETVRLIILSNENMRFIYRHAVDGGSFEVDTAEIIETLDGAPLNAPLVMAWLQEFLEDNMAEIRGAAENRAARG
jgi:anti-sigma regulatory factor (Ser/Thr protein kinase)